MLWAAGGISAFSARAVLLGCGVFRGSQAVVPVAVSLGPDAGDVGVDLDEPLGGVIAGVICVVSTCDVVQVEGVDPCWQRGCEAGGGEEEVDLAHGGHLDCGEGVDGALDEQGGSGSGVSCDPESAAGFPGSGGHAAEGWSGAGLGEASCGAVCVGVGVVSACDVPEVGRVDPWRESGCQAGDGEEDVEAVHLVELVCGEGIDRALEEERVLRGSSRDPEAAAGPSGSGSHALEGVSGSGSDDFGAGMVAARVASEEDCVGSAISGEDVLPEAGADEFGSDAAPAFKILPDFGAWIGAACGLMNALEFDRTEGRLTDEGRKVTQQIRSELQHIWRKRR